MAGIYVHIPFCRKKCSYCDFHFSVSNRYRNDIVASLIKELNLNHDYLQKKDLDSIYFGGGTPSVLSSQEISSILNEINKHFTLSEDIEMTLEANPDDISGTYMIELKKVGINRLSLGVQSFNDEELKLLNRTHSSDEAIVAINTIKDADFENSNIDLIFGVLGSTFDKWKFNLDKFLELDIEHLSAYNLTIEPKTILHHQIKHNKVNPPDEKLSSEMFIFTHQYLGNEGYDHYEISNYAKNGRYAKHNTNYWQDVPYLGLGPSAHSYDGVSRRWNVSNNKKYVKALSTGNLPFVKEELTTDDKYNEYIMTGLRTMWGVEAAKIRQFGNKYFDHFNSSIEKKVNDGFVIKIGQNYCLSDKGLLFCDKISMELFV